MVRAGSSPEHDGGGGVRFRSRLHPITFAGAASLAAFVVLATGLVIRNNDLAPTTDRIVALVGGVLAVACLVPSYVRWRTSAFAVTDEWLRMHVRFLATHRLELPANDVAAVEVGQSWLGRRLDYGTVHVAAADGTVESFAPVAHAVALRDAVADAARARRRR